MTETETKIPQWMQDEVAEYDLDLINPPATVLDIGANIGAFTMRAAARWPQAKITAFEPVHENADGFSNNCLSEVEGSPIELNRLAVRSFTGEDDIQLGDLGVVCGFHDLGRSTGERRTVRCVDAATLSSAEFVKVDTEGCELEILQRLDLSKTVALVCEYHRGDWHELQSVLDRSGMVLVQRTSRSATHGVLKYARPGSLKRPDGLRDNPIPDDTIISGRTKDGVTFSMPAVCIRNPFFKPELRGLKLFIGLPIYQQMPTYFAKCLLALQAQKPLPIDIHICQGDGVARSRNSLTSEFLKSDCTHLLFMDSDLIFSADHITKLLSRKLPVVGGFYPKKQQGPLEWVINTLPGDPPQTDDGLKPVRYIGTGFICIAREVFEKMAAHYPEIKFREDYGIRGDAHDFWSMGVYRDKDGSTRYLSEDWYFCQRWLDMGGKIFGDCNVVLKHYGPVIFPLDTQEAEMYKPVSRPDSLPASDKAAELKS